MRRLPRLLVGFFLVLAGTGLASAPRAGASTWWAPALGSQPWQWELSHPLKLTNGRDMGTDDRLPNGKHAPAPVIYDIDGIINPRSTVSALHARGKHVVCYVEVGAAGNYYSAGRGGRVHDLLPAASRRRRVRGKVPGYPEYYLNIHLSLDGLHHRVDDRQAVCGQGLRCGRDRHRRGVRQTPVASP